MKTFKSFDVKLGIDGFCTSHKTLDVPLQFGFLHLLAHFFQLLESVPLGRNSLQELDAMQYVFLVVVVYYLQVIFMYLVFTFSNFWSFLLLLEPQHHVVQSS